MGQKEEKIEIKLSAIADIISRATQKEQVEVISYLINRLNIPEKKVEILVKEKEAAIPATIFNKDLSCLESIVRFLKEEKLWSIKEISAMLNRSPKTIWATYYNSSKKLKHNLRPLPTDYTIPLSLFRQRKLSVLETVTKYLKDNYSLTYREIAKLLHRDYKTVWGIYQKANKR